MNIKRMSTDEKILQFLINKNKSSKSDTVSLNVNDADSLNIPHEDIVRAFYNLQTDGYLTIIESSANNDFSRYWTFKLLSEGKHYFENKKSKSKANRREWIRTYLPISISLIALIKSFTPEILALWELLWKLINRCWKRQEGNKDVFLPTCS